MRESGPVITVWVRVAQDEYVYLNNAEVKAALLGTEHNSMVNRRINLGL